MFHLSNSPYTSELKICTNFHFIKDAYGMEEKEKAITSKLILKKEKLESLYITKGLKIDVQKSFNFVKLGTHILRITKIEIPLAFDPSKAKLSSARVSHGGQWQEPIVTHQQRRQRRQVLAFRFRILDLSPIQTRCFKYCFRHQ